MFSSVISWVRSHYWMWKIRREAKKFLRGSAHSRVESRQFGGWDGVVMDDKFTEDYTQNEFVQKANKEMAAKTEESWEDPRKNPYKD